MHLTAQAAVTICLYKHFEGAARMGKETPIDYEEVYCRYIMRKGKKIYPKNAKYFHFWVKKKPDTNVTSSSSN